MTEHLQPGDVLDATVTQSAPFGALVVSATGVPGLVPGASADVGDELRVRVTGFDAEKQRFAAELEN